MPELGLVPAAQLPEQPPDNLVQGHEGPVLVIAYPTDIKMKGHSTRTEIWGPSFNILDYLLASRSSASNALPEYVPALDSPALHTPAPIDPAPSPPAARPGTISWATFYHFLSSDTIIGLVACLETCLGMLVSGMRFERYRENCRYQRVLAALQDQKNRPEGEHMEDGDVEVQQKSNDGVKSASEDQRQQDQDSVNSDGHIAMNSSSSHPTPTPRARHRYKTRNRRSNIYP